MCRPQAMCVACDYARLSQLTPVRHESPKFSTREHGPTSSCCKTESILVDFLPSKLSACNQLSTGAHTPSLTSPPCLSIIATAHCKHYYSEDLYYFINRKLQLGSNHVTLDAMLTVTTFLDSHTTNALLSICSGVNVASLRYRSRAYAKMAELGGSVCAACMDACTVSGSRGTSSVRYTHK